MLLAFSCLATLSTALSDPVADRAKLTMGVGELVAEGGVPGAMTATGSPAFVVLTADEDGVKVPLFVATHLGKGRALAGGHSCFFGEHQLQNPNNKRFTVNALSWLAGKPLSGLKVGFMDDSLPAQLLESLGIITQKVTRANLVSQLAQIDVLWMGQGALDGDPQDQERVQDYVSSGGALEISGCGWGWQQVNPSRKLLTYQTGNRLLGNYGIHFSGDAVGGPYTPSGADNELLTTYGAVNQLQQPGNKPEVAKAAIITLDHALDSLPPGDTSLKTLIETNAMAEAHGLVMPTSQNQISWSTPFSRLEAKLELRAWREARPEEVIKNPAAADFPGAIPVGSPRVSKLVAIDTHINGWHPVGLYAAPGEPVTVTISTAARSAHLSVRVGPQTDTLWDNDAWSRFPEVTQEVALTAEETTFANPFGGLIYVNVPDGCTLGSTSVRIIHAVEAPLFVLGKTSKLEWEQAQRAPAPWADLVGQHVSLSLPHFAIMKVSDPDALMRFWDDVFRNCCELYQVPERDRQERYCVDRQISAGYMHSGYPIMTFEDVAGRFANLSELLEHGGQNWGFYHEMGHNFQQADWTFDGTGEVTNNLFSVYGNEMLNGLTPATYKRVHDGLDPVNMRKNIVNYLAKGAKFEDWKNDPFLALSMYMQLRVGFGWDAYKHLFKEYSELPNSQRPKNDDEKRDQWMVRFSREVHRNLGPFFQAWGVPTSEAARKSVTDLPTWMPSDWPGKTG